MQLESQWRCSCNRQPGITKRCRSCFDTQPPLFIWCLLTKLIRAKKEEGRMRWSILLSLYFCDISKTILKGVIHHPEELGVGNYILQILQEKEFYYLCRNCKRWITFLMTFREDHGPVEHIFYDCESLEIRESLGSSGRTKASPPPFYPPQQTKKARGRTSMELLKHASVMAHGRSRNGQQEHSRSTILAASLMLYSDNLWLHILYPS